MDLTTGLILTTLALATIGAAFCYRNEKRQWNSGVCARCNQPWTLFDVDSQGGRGYKCDKHALWISWPVDRKKEIAEW